MERHNDASQRQDDMFEAARTGHTDIIARLLALDPSLVDARFFRLQQTPLHVAAMEGRAGVVAQLLAVSPQSSNARDSQGWTVFHFAACSGNAKIMARLLAHNPNPALIDAVTDDNSTALHFAAGRGHEAIVVQLLNLSPGLIDMKTAADTYALHIAASRCYVKLVAELLARRPSSLAWEDGEGRTPLFWAVSTGDQELVDLFPLPIDQVHRRDRDGNTLLHLVFSGVRSLKPAFIEKLWGMNPDALFVADTHGYTPFDCAIWWGNEWAIEHFQWKLSMWSVEEALKKVRQHSDSMTKILKEPQRPKREYRVRGLRQTLQQREQRFREVVQGECEGPLLLSLPRDCVGLIYDYLLDSTLGGL